MALSNASSSVRFDVPPHIALMVMAGDGFGYIACHSLDGLWYDMLATTTCRGSKVKWSDSNFTQAGLKKMISLSSPPTAAQWFARR